MKLVTISAEELNEMAAERICLRQEEPKVLSIQMHTQKKLKS